MFCLCLFHSGKENENVVGAWKDIEYHQALDIADVQKVKKQKTDLTSSHPPITSAAPGEGPFSSEFFLSFSFLGVRFCFNFLSVYFI